ncbi:tripartite tricarboxylate transporter substrate-binding protein [Falsiroseomonas sp.]|uniref:tripartite tricarboxylate transporter substrate-binding protein n=1 Tax=Falsiroseomonas sp. TaxID=2870721 RepID=UPI0034A18B55
MTTPRRTALAMLAGLALPGIALAGRREPVEMLVPAAPGSAPDRWARGMAPFLERAWPRQPVIVRNQPGRHGLDALAELGQAGRRKVVGVLTTPLILARAVETAEASPLSRISPLAALVEEPVILVAAPGGATSAEALRNAAPGVAIGTPPAGTGSHLTGLRLADSAGLPLLVFPTAAAARQAASAGHVAASVLTLPDAIGYLRDERLVALGVASSRRIALLPDLPTLREAGLEALGATRRGFALSPDAPAEWRSLLLAGLGTLANDPDLATHCAENGRVPRFLGHGAWGALLARQDEELRRRWREDPWLPRRA